MASERDTIPSDNEGAEKPVREQLKKAHIAPQPPGTDPANPASGVSHNSNAETIEQARQRSSSEEMPDDIHGDADAAVTRQHTRKRSRDSTAEEDKLNNGQRKVSGERSRDDSAAVESSDKHKRTNGASKTKVEERATTPEVVGEERTESTIGAMMSPKTKRSRLQSASGEDSAHRVEEASKKEGTKIEADAEVEPASKAASSGGFANTSALSPFGALGGSKSPSAEPPQTSSSAFASSGFSMLSGAPSGFGAIGKDSGSFGSGGGFATFSSEQESNAKPASSGTFGGALGQKSAFAGVSTAAGGFGSGATGFGSSAQPSTGGFGGGLGGSAFSSIGSTGGLKSFASGKSTTTFGASARSAKAFGAPPDDDDDADADADEREDAEGKDDGTGLRSPLASTEEDKQDERFYEQDLETGEEDETTQYSCRAKLYNFATLPDGKKEWRERGLGVLRLNLKRSPEDHSDDPPKARFLMRAEGSHRVVLNTPIQKTIKFGDPAGGAPQGGYMYFMGTIEGAAKLELLQLKMRQQYALELYEKISELQAGM